MEKFFKHPWVIVGLIAAITVFFAAQLPKARMDNNMTAFLPAGNPARLASKHLDAQYGEEITIILGLERPYGTVFDRGFLSRLREYTQAAENIELIKEARSIMSTQYITSDSESIIVAELVDDGFSGTQEEIAELKRRIASWDMYQGALVSDDLSSAQVMITINASSDDAGNPEIVAILLRLRDMAKEMFAGYATVYTAGQPVVDGALVEFFNERAEVNRSDRFIREHFGGSTQLILSVEADDTETLLSPATLTALDGLSAYLIERVPRVTKVVGFADTIKRVNQVFNVDESPDGIAARPEAAYDSETSGFGFGDFGFEDNEDFEGGRAVPKAAAFGPEGANHTVVKTSTSPPVPDSSSRVSGVPSAHPTAAKPQAVLSPDPPSS